MTLLFFWRRPSTVEADIAALRERIAKLEAQLARARKRLARLTGTA